MAHDSRPTACPTCGRFLSSATAVRGHHKQVHDLALAGVPREEWSEYVERHADEIVNPEGLTVRDHRVAPRHPLYANAEDGE